MELLYSSRFCPYKKLTICKNFLGVVLSVPLAVDIQKQIIAVLKQTTAKKVEPYLGQLSDYKEPELGVDDLPIIYIDYTGSIPDGIRKEFKFNIYIVNIAFSKNEKNRAAAHNKLLKLLDEIDEKLNDIVSQDFEVLKTKKIFDAKIEKGYLTIYTKDLKVQTTNEEQIWNDSKL